MTVLFCDLVGSTALAGQLDPEELRAVIATYHRCVTLIVERYEGFVAKFLGDGVLAFFGYPTAHELDVQRAIETGLDLSKAVAELDTAAGRLGTRVGIATGLVVVGAITGQGDEHKHDVVGEAPNLAARLQTVAKPGGLVIDAVTRELAGQRFEYSLLHDLQLKGFNDPVLAFAVARRRSSETKLEPLRASGIPQIARSDEVGTILRRWERARAGEGCVVAVSAEPGIGKTKLLLTAADMISRQDVTVLWLFCFPHHQHSPLFPFIDLLIRIAGWSSSDGAAERAAKLTALVGDHDAGLALSAMAGVEVKENVRAEPSERRRLVMKAVLGVIEDIAARSPLVLIFEDAHWIDPTSEDLLDKVVTWSEGRQVLLMVSYRPELRPVWVGQPHVTSVVLTRLTQTQTASLVRELSRGRELQQDLVDDIVERSDGVPLFAEEMTKAAVELHSQPKRTGANTRMALPPTLQASLVSRLDALTPQAREMVQIGACIGREFSPELIAAVSDVPQQRIETILAELVPAGLLVRNWAGPWPAFAFRHALIKDAAYELLLRGSRRRIHSSIADALKTVPSLAGEVRPETIAHHLAESGRWDEAFAAWTEAGNNALATAAHQEAATLLSRALNALEQMSVTPKSLAATIDVRWRLHNALYPLGRLKEALENLLASELCAVTLGEQDKFASVLTSQTYLLGAMGDLERAASTGERAVALARGGSPWLQADALLMLARTLYAAGRYVEAVDHAEEAVRLLGDDVTASKTVGLNAAVASQVWLALCLAERGYDERADKHASRGLQLADHPVCGQHEKLWAAVGASRGALLRGQWQIAVDLLSPMLPLCEGPFRVYFPRVASTLGAALQKLGRAEEAEALLVQADRMAIAIGFAFGHALVLALMSEVQRDNGRLQDALRSAERAVEVARTWGERGNEARALYALAMALERLGDNDAREQLGRALELAQATGMKELSALLRRQRRPLASGAATQHRRSTCPGRGRPKPLHRRKRL